MATRLRPHLLLVAVLALGMGSAWLEAPPAAEAAAAKLPAWTGGVNLYRNGTFTTQKSWLWCTAAGVQIVRNIVDQETDHSTAGQRRYFDWMRRHNRYELPLSAGVDPAGWTAGLRHFVDDRYRLVSSRSFDSALRSAVTRLRQTNLPVALTVSHGNHGWILTGFRATADPAVTSRFTVTSVRVTGPLYGLQSKNGYDMPPNTKLSTAQLERFFTPWKYAPKAMVWDGRYVSIQPVPQEPPAAAAATPTPSPVAAALPLPVPSVSAVASAGTVGSPLPAPSASEAAAAVNASGRPTATIVEAIGASTPAAEGSPGAMGIIAIGVGVLAAAVALAIRVRRRAV